MLPAAHVPARTPACLPCSLLKGQHAPEQRVELNGTATREHYLQRRTEVGRALRHLLLLCACPSPLPEVHPVPAGWEG